jgi:hypothetical protein
MPAKLTFRADVNGRPFGVIVVKGGVATARVNRWVLRNVLLGHAMLWIESRRPSPSASVRFQLVGRMASA